MHTTPACVSMLEADDEIIGAIPTVQARPLRTLFTLSYSLSLSPTDTRDREGDNEKFKHKWGRRESDMVMIMLEKGVDTRAKRCHHKCAILNRYHAHTTCYRERES